MKKAIRYVMMAFILGSFCSISLLAQYTPNQGTCSGPVTGPHGDPSTSPYGDSDPDGEFPAFLHSNAPSAQAATCHWTEFTTTDYYTPADMTLSVEIDSGSEVGSGAIEYFTAAGQRFNNAQQGTYYITVPAGTNLRTFTVNAYAKANTSYYCNSDGSNCQGSEATIQINSLSIQ